ncbi:MAG TPA: SDR family oxidoreductase [Acidimicrobiia bacterium]|jgi:NAD(P)-dependent dehydrogenase (short-subunit alcohol dehydrogenase family)|nr:SDR family oxidoreductase [Acidimicrobiia bacterium]
MVVSGVGPGLGREIVAVALREGASVMMGARREENLEAIAGELDPSGERVAWHRTDISDPAAAAGLVDAAVEHFGRLDSLVNCAALDTVFGGLEQADFDAWRQTFEVNVFGTLRVCEAAIPHLKERGGSIVFIGSQATYWPQLMQMAYASSKGALTTAMYYLAKELGPSKIRVNTVVPTWMWGPPVEGYVDMTAEGTGVSREEVIAGITKNMPLGEIPADEDVAEVVAFFASDRARMVSGQALFVNAGEFPH